MIRIELKLAAAVVLTVLFSPAIAQQTPSSIDALTAAGNLTVNGHVARYVIHRLPPSSFPDLPAAVLGVLSRQGCMIPQTYEAHRPENVIRGAFERAGSSDWALLCSAKGTVSLMVFFASAPERPMIVASAPETARLQAHDPTGVLGFNWGIDPATPERIHEAQSGMEHRPPMPDHDAIADSVVDQKTIYRFYTSGKWTLVDLPE